MEAALKNQTAICVGLCLSLYCVPSAQADKIQFDCSGAVGSTYYAEEGIVLKGEGGWSDAAISEGQSLIILDTSTANITYTYKDATGAWFDPKKDEGAEINIISLDPTDLSFMFEVRFGTTTIELHTIAEVDPTIGTARLLSASARNSKIFTSSRLNSAECSVVRVP
jgi:hypothetical protein